MTLVNISLRIDTTDDMSSLYKNPITDVNTFRTPKSEGITMYFEKDIPTAKRVSYRKDVSLPYVTKHGFSMGPFASAPPSSEKQYTKFVLHMELLENLEKKWNKGDLKKEREVLGTPSAKGMTREEARLMLDGRDPELWKRQCDCFAELFEVHDT
ncbi:hypothetical protein T439DRAFT_182904 [Meredithblackwellia eburnea MCA 4105]